MSGDGLLGPVLVDGRAGDPTVPVWDGAVVRGDGCFEAVRIYEGHPFALDLHLDRLERSARVLDVDLPARADLESWCQQASAGVSGVLRIVVTRGAAIPGTSGAGRCLVFAHSVVAPPASLALTTVSAPWHSAGRPWDLAGAKTLSYAPNQAATRRARSLGGDDALLVSGGGLVLEGPTFSVGWVTDGALETPSLDLLVLDSITRRLGLEDARRLSIHVEEGRFGVDRLLGASEVLAWSTTKEVCPVSRVDQHRFEPGPVTARLAAAFADRIASVQRLDEKSSKVTASTDG